MKEFAASLLREKFVIHDPAVSGSTGRPVVALSNRLIVELRSHKGQLQEVFIVRAQNMHSCVRMCARVIQSFEQGGPLLNRQTPFDWPSAWDAAINRYEENFNPQRWVAVYNKGKVVFDVGERHPLLDVIEKCDATNKGAYDDSIPMAEDAFKQTGKVVKLEYDGNVALVVNFEKNQGRLGIILRGADKTTTFNFSAVADKNKTLNIPQCLGTAAAFLEGIQLAFQVGMNSEKMRMGMFERFSKDEKQVKEGRRRLSRLNAEIANLEAAYEVRYRPERPEFQKTLMDAEKLAQKILEPPPKKKKEEPKEEKEDD